jgi:hypothetical protein
VTTLSACIIARNEEERLPAALASVAFADEVVVVDSGSTDGTVALARAAGAVVVEHPWQGFARQRNVAIDTARGDWILEVDADERVTPALQGEIAAFLADPPPGIDICGLPLRDLFLGATLGPSAKYPRYRLRLFRRDAYRHDERRVVHEGLVPAGPVWPLAGELEHVLAGDWGEALRDAWAYARLESTQVAAPGGAAAYARAIVLRPAGKFAYRLVVDGGWRDGAPGLARIALDCASDSVVMARRALRRTPGETMQGHFGRQNPHIGPARIVALGIGALPWLEAAREAGADVALIAEAPAATVRTRVVRRFGPLHVIRAVDAESQLRRIDLLVGAPGRAARLARLVPAALRSGVGSIDADAGAVAGDLAGRPA